jgi:hypothetical protein
VVEGRGRVVPKLCTGCPGRSDLTHVSWCR